MKILKYISIVFLFMTMAIISACNSEAAQDKQYDEQMLYGRWEITSAERDGKPTETLDSTYFDFGQNGRLVSNFNLEGTEEAGTYEFANNTIREKKTNGLSYTVDTMSTDRMILLTQFMNLNFRLVLEKK